VFAVLIVIALFVALAVAGHYFGADSHSTFGDRSGRYRDH
jgi:hypothetical protein